MYFNLAPLISTFVLKNWCPFGAQICILGHQMGFFDSLSVEEKYQEGIELIKQEKWHDVGVTLVGLQDKNYKDSKVLYKYAAAKEELAGGSDYSSARPGSSRKNGGASCEGSIV